MRRLFVCERPYPLYKTLLRSMNAFGENDILLSNHVDGMEKMYEPLKNSKIFKSIYYLDDVLYNNFYNTFKENANQKIAKNPRLILSYFRQFLAYIKLMSDAKSIELPKGLDPDSYDQIICK